MHAHAAQEAHRPRLLFVDDEQRVLNSMRIMFRRQFELFLASHGAEALDIVRDKDIDVIVADHRMPKMTGVEVLSKVRAMSPRTVRILLTGYADLDAVEGSINESEVFRFLTKPCAPQQLRETIELAAKLAREAPAPEPTAALSASDTPGDTIEIILQSDTVTEVTGSKPPVTSRTSGTALLEQPKFPPHRAEAPAPAPAVGSRPKLAAGLGIVVFSMDNEVVDCVNKAVRGRLPVYNAGNIVQVVKCLTEQRPGVLVTDVSEDKATIQSMTARLKEHLPQLVTIAVSQHRDVLDMVWLINHGQIFRFLRKPLSAGRTAISLQAALQHHRQLLKNPELAKRHEVDGDAAEAGPVDGVLAKLKGLKRLWTS
ncbi:MAG TPA: response regulator [Gammaproteobacteria bacterium]|nr:response regulator [Gammaproteobacteria bacterium]